MKTKRLGSSDLELTVVGLGTWAIGGSWQFGWGEQDERDSIDTIRMALEMGINWIDTAPIYGCGESEKVIGKALGDIGGGERPLIATKCGLLWNEKREKINCLDGDSIMNECEQSLRRLKIETIDLYQMHWPAPDGQIEEAFEAMDKCRRQGKVRFIAVCNANVKQMERLGQVGELSSLQPPYSLLDRRSEKLFPYCGQNEIGVVCYSPMQKGLLTGKVTHEFVESLAEDDHRRRDRDFNEPMLSTHMKFVDDLTNIARRHDRTVAQLAIAWTLHRPEVTSAIVGARRPGQIEETAKAAEFVLSADDLKEIEELWEKYYG